MHPKPNKTIWCVRRVHVQEVQRGRPVGGQGRRRFQHAAGLDQLHALLHPRDTRAHQETVLERRRQGESQKQRRRPTCVSWQTASFAARVVLHKI